MARDEGWAALPARAWRYAVTRVVDRGTVVWFLRYTDPAKRPLYPSDRELLRAETGDEHEFLDRYRPLHPAVRRAREAAGGERWYVLEDGELAYTIWTYSGHAIVADRPLLTLPLPPATVQVEDAFTPARKRAQHISAETFDRLHRMLAARGIEHVVTKVDSDNTPAISGARATNWTTIAEVHGTRWLQRWTRWRVDRVSDFYPQLDELAHAPSRGDTIS